jgi:hypothetical protein
MQGCETKKYTPNLSLKLATVLATISSMIVPLQRAPSDQNSLNAAQAQGLKTQNS